MNIVDFFDINNIDHLKAYQNLIQFGTWPEGFVPEGTEYGQAWRMQIASKMAKEYVETKLLEADRDLDNSQRYRY